MHPLIVCICCALGHGLLIHGLLLLIHGLLLLQHGLLLLQHGLLLQLERRLLCM